MINCSMIAASRGLLLVLDCGSQFCEWLEILDPYLWAEVTFFTQTIIAMGSLSAVLRYFNGVTCTNFLHPKRLPFFSFLSFTRSGIISWPKNYQIY